MLDFILIIGWLILLSYYLSIRKTRIIVPNYKMVPTVDYNWPLVGHGISFGRDIIGFIETCRKRYGDVFHIKVFRKDICVVCDKTLVKEFFKKQEDEMSMYENLKAIYFDYAFSDNGDGLNRTIDIMNNTVGVRFDEFLPKIVEESKKIP